MNTTGKPDPESILSPFGTRFVSGWKDEGLKCVKYDTSKLNGKAAIIYLSRPENRNAWSEIMRNEIIFCMEKANRDPKVRVIIITGDPAGKAFCFGADLSPASRTNPTSVEGDVPMDRPANLSYWRDGGGQAGLSIVRSLKPVIAAVNGSAVGVGMTLPLCCDVSVANEDPKVGFVFGKRGLTMECLSSYFLERVVGYKIAMELVLTGRVFSAKDAPHGLFNYTVPENQVLAKALELAGEMCETSGMSCMYNRNLIIRNGYGTSPEQAHLIESKTIFASLNHADAREGINSFLQKRKADYKMDPFKEAPDWFPWWFETSIKARL